MCGPWQVVTPPSRKDCDLPADAQGTALAQVTRLERRPTKMAYSITMKVLLPALGLAGLVACGGSDQNTAPKTPDSNVTSVTGGTEPGASSMASSPQTTPGQDLNPAPQASAPSTTTPPNTDMGSSVTSNSGAASGTASTPDTTLSDGQIAAVVETANKGEIDQAKTALKKSKNARVRQFAQHMVTDHTGAMNDEKTVDQKNGITPQANDVSDGIKSNGEKVMSQLNSSAGDSFDKAYIDAQVDEHQKVLDTLDNKLIPKAQNADLKSLLEKVRAKVAGHLKMAQDVQASLSH
jgi:putative membrane protein